MVCVLELKYTFIFHVFSCWLLVKMFFFLEKYCVPCFCLNSQQWKTCHWHCPECQHILCRAPDFKKHLQNHGVCNVTSYILKSCFILISSMLSLIPLIFLYCLQILLLQAKLPTSQCMCFWYWYFWMFNIYWSLSTYCLYIFVYCSSERPSSENPKARQHVQEQPPVICIDERNSILSPQKMPMDPEKPAMPLEYHIWVVPLTINRLENLFLYKDLYPKMFVKWKINIICSLSVCTFIFITKGLMRNTPKPWRCKQSNLSTLAYMGNWHSGVKVIVCV